MSGRSRGGQRKKKNNSGNNSSNNNKGNNNKGNKSSSKKKVDPKKFWGDHNTLPSIEGFETSTPDPVAVVNSLGQPPLPGHGPASPHYFKLVYTRAAQLAGALAMAGEIDVLSPLEPPEPEAPAEPGNEAEAETADDEDEPLVELSADDDASVEDARAEQE